MIQASIPREKVIYQQNKQSKTILCLSDTHHVVPEWASHLCLGPLAEMEAVGTEVGAIRATILKVTGQIINQGI